MPYCITFRSKSDAYPTGWYTGDNCRWSTDHKRKKLFDRREDAEPVVVRCGSSAPAMLRASMLRRGGQMKPDLDENLGRLVRISGAQLSRASVPTSTKMRSRSFLSPTVTSLLLVPADGLVRQNCIHPVRFFLVKKLAGHSLPTSARPSLGGQLPREAKARPSLPKWDGREARGRVQDREQA